MQGQLYCSSDGRSEEEYREGGEAGEVWRVLLPEFAYSGTLFSSALSYNDASFLILDSTLIILLFGALFFFGICVFLMFWFITCLWTLSVVVGDIECYDGF